MSGQKHTAKCPRRFAEAFDVLQNVRADPPGLLQSCKTSALSRWGF